jgi:uncharacterized membrane protein YfcA
VLGTGWTEIVALVAAYVVAVLATPAGISGAVLLLPFQVSVLGTPSPAVTPTNLLYNVVATPGALYRYWRQHQTGGRLALVLIAGTLPGVIAGSVIRVELLPGPRVFDLVVAAVLMPLGFWLALTRPSRPDESDRPARLIPVPVLVVLAAVVGCVGGIYGIGGGSILAPILIGSGRRPAELAPAALASTFVTSVAGVITFTIFAAPSRPCRSGLAPASARRHRFADIRDTRKYLATSRSLARRRLILRPPAAPAPGGPAQPRSARPHRHTSCLRHTAAQASRHQAVTRC